MSLLEIVLISLGLAMDAFAVSLAAGASQHNLGPRGTFRLAFHFGLFQFFMPIIGWLLGAGAAPLFESLDHWVAFALLMAIGLHMVKESFQPHDDKDFRVDPSRGWTLVLLSIGTSTDALAVGLSLAMLGTNIVLPCVIIGLITGSLALIGVKTGGFLGVKVGKRMETFGGIVLCLIGLRVLVEHLGLLQ